MLTLTQVLEPSDDVCFLIYQGPLRLIVAYRSRIGDVPVREFLENSDVCAKARYMLKFKKMCENGPLRGDEFRTLKVKQHKEAKGLSEFKDISSKSRILAVNDGERSQLVLLHGFTGKKEDDIKAQEILMADRYRRDYESRVAHVYVRIDAAHGRRGKP